MPDVYGRLKDLINVALGVALAVVGVFASIFLDRQEYIHLFEQRDWVRLGLIAALLAATLVWMFGYHSAVRNELDIVADSFDANRLRNFSMLKGPITPVSVILSIIFGCMIMFVGRIAIYSALASILSIVDMYGSSLVNRNIGIMIFREYFKGDLGRDRAEVLFNYYFSNPLQVRIAFILTGFFAAFLCSLLSRAEGADFLEMVAYSVTIVTIVVGQLVIRRWRAKRDADLAGINDNTVQ